MQRDLVRGGRRRTCGRRKWVAFPLAGQRRLPNRPATFEVLVQPLKLAKKGGRVRNGNKDQTGVGRPIRCPELGVIASILRARRTVPSLIGLVLFVNNSLKGNHEQGQHEPNPACNIRRSGLVLHAGHASYRRSPHAKSQLSPTILFSGVVASKVLSSHFQRSPWQSFKSPSTGVRIRSLSRPATCVFPRIGPNSSPRINPSSPPCRGRASVSSPACLPRPKRQLRRGVKK